MAAPRVGEIPSSDETASSGVMSPNPELKVRQLEERLNKFIGSEDARHAFMLEQCKRVNESVATSRSRFQMFTDHLSKQIGLLQSKVEDMSDSQRADGKASVLRLQGALQRAAADFSQDMTKERSLTEDQLAYLLSRLGDEIQRVNTEVCTLRASRTEFHDRIHNSVGTTIKSLTSEVEAFRVQRETSFEQMREMVVELGQRISAEIENQVVSRVTAQEEILKLLEETCTRVETALAFQAGHKNGSESRRAVAGSHAAINL